MNPSRHAVAAPARRDPHGPDFHATRPSRGCNGWESVCRLATEPRPPESFAYGSPDLRRLRAGRYRVFYTIDEEQRVVQIDHVARVVYTAAVAGVMPRCWKRSCMPMRRVS
jgi:hypothetical protein